MREHYLTSTSRADMHGLAHQGVSAPDHFNQLQDIVRRRLGEEHARFFAKPVPNPGRREIDWYSPLTGPARRFVDLPEAEQAALRPKIRATAQEIYRCAEAQGPSRAGQMGRHILQLALCCPGEEALWVVGESPLCVNWGYGPGAPGQEPLKLWELPDPVVPEPEPEPEPAAAVAASGRPSPPCPPLPEGEGGSHPSPSGRGAGGEGPHDATADAIAPEPLVTPASEPLLAPPPVPPAAPPPGEPEEEERRFRPNWWWLLPAGLAGVALFLLMLRLGYPSVQTLLDFQKRGTDEQARRERLAKLEQSLGGLWQDVERRAAQCRHYKPKPPPEPPKPPDPPPPDPPKEPDPPPPDPPKEPDPPPPDPPKEPDPPPPDPPKEPDPPPDPPKPPEPPPDPCANSQGIEFVLIQPGKFMMGSPDGEGEANERPQHEVTLTRAFCMGKFEVTQDQWQKVMGTNPSKHQGGNHPVDNVSWNDAQAFIKKLNAAEGKERFRLPTEAEWEYAARAGTTTPYFFGENTGELTNYDWCRDNAGNTTHPVGQKLPNPWGLHDLYCNVDEWVQDRYSAYKAAPASDPQGPRWLGIGRIIRGGCYTHNGRSATRWNWSASRRESHAGLRLALIPLE